MKRQILATLVTMIALALTSTVYAGPITVTAANDWLQFTNQTATTYNGLVSYTISETSYNAVGSLTVSRSDTALVYQWAATPDFANTKGVQIGAVDIFTLANASDFRLTFTGFPH